jgi:hypothetical protein
MKNKLQLLPLPVILLPFFFVLHGFLENYGYINLKDAALLTGLYILYAGALFILFLALYRNRIKAGLAAAMLLAIFFFFGALQDFFKSHFAILNRYSVLLPALLIIAAIVIIFLRRTKRTLRRFNLFLNCLLLVYIIVDLTAIAGRMLSGSKNKSYSGNVPFIPCDTCQHPDIYFLVFDAYQGSSSLKEKYHYDNSEFDRFLQREGFHIQAKSHANYKYTILSMPSILNMSYLDKLSSVKGGPVQEYYYLSDLIRKNQLTDFLVSMGYDVVNCSIFDLQGNPSPITESLLPLKTRLITDQTLFSRCMRDIGWHLFQFSHDPFSEKVLYGDLNNNNTLIKDFNRAIAAPALRPRFVYGHFNLPHPPYYFDKDRKRNAIKKAYTAEDEDDIQSYLDYLNYTNDVAENLILKIKKATNGKAVIIFMGDHGLRYHDQLEYNPPWFLQNQNAVYFPGKEYGQLYDSISGVNQFRVVLNTLFKQNIPLLKDSIVNVKDKK